MSQLIIFDMEWNSGYRPYHFRYQGAEQTLRGEILQIGAVKMDGQEITDTFQLNVRPRIFRTLHHHVAKMTGLTQQDLNAGMPAAAALKKFKAWCGKDAVLGEWGTDDIPVLKQNLFLNGLDESWPTQWYDLQKVYAAQRPLQEGESLGLEGLVNRLGITIDHALHNALADALYTAKVLQFVDIQKGLAAYPTDETQLRELLCPPTQNRQDFACWAGLIDEDAWRRNPTIQAAQCPDCGKPLTPSPKHVWLNQGNNCIYSMESCPQHGPVMVWMRRTRPDGIHYQFGRATEKPDQRTQAKWEKDQKRALERMRRQQERASAAPRTGRKNG